MWRIHLLLLGQKCLLCSIAVIFPSSREGICAQRDHIKGSDCPTGAIAVWVDWRWGPLPDKAAQRANSDWCKLNSAHIFLGYRTSQLPTESLLKSLEKGARAMIKGRVSVLCNFGWCVFFLETEFPAALWLMLLLSLTHKCWDWRCAQPHWFLQRWELKPGLAAC